MISIIKVDIIKSRPFARFASIKEREYNPYRKTSSVAHWFSSEFVLDLMSHKLSFYTHPKIILSENGLCNDIFFDVGQINFHLTDLNER